jgi:molybdate transport system ATP-binding protein
MGADGTLHVRASLSAPGGFKLDVEFEAPPGVTVLFGPSGSGKSTTLSAIAGLVRPLTGRIALGETPWFDDAAGVDVAVHLRRAAYVFQSLALFPHMTAADNVGYGMPAQTGKEERRARATQLLARLHVPHLADRRPHTFSGGEAQRVALARALAMEPRVVLLDEPFSALDRGLRIALVAELRDALRELAVPVVFVTHHRQEARALGDRLVVLEAGRVKSTGSLEPLAQGTTDMSFDETPLDPDGALR